MINSWWSYGNAYAAISGKPVILDRNTYESQNFYWFSRALLTTNESVSRGILTMMDCGTYLEYNASQKELAAISCDSVDPYVIVSQEDLLKLSTTRAFATWNFDAGVFQQKPFSVTSPQSCSGTATNLNCKNGFTIVDLEAHIDDHHPQRLYWYGDNVTVVDFSDESDLDFSLIVFVLGDEYQSFTIDTNYAESMLVKWLVDAPLEYFETTTTITHPELIRVLHVQNG